MSNPFQGTATSGGEGGGMPADKAPPPGNRIAVCLCLIDLGTHERKPFKGEPRKPAREVFVVWELAKCLIPGTQKRHLVAERYVMSFHEKAALRQMVESWTGPVKNGQPLAYDVLPGLACYLNIVHEPRKEGEGVYVKIKAVAPLPEEAQAPQTTYAKPFFWYVGCGRPLPDMEWLPWCYGSKVADLVKASPEWQALGEQARQHVEQRATAPPSQKRQAPQPAADDYEPPYSGSARDDSDLPF